MTGRGSLRAVGTADLAIPESLSQDFHPRGTFSPWDQFPTCHRSGIPKRRPVTDSSAPSYTHSQGASSVSLAPATHFGALPATSKNISKNSEPVGSPSRSSL